MKSNSKVILFSLFLSLTSILSCAQTDKNNQLLTSFNSIVESAVEKEKFSGAVMISYNNEVIYENAVGYLDASSTSTNKTNTRFNVGSMNKMHTAVAILQLAQKNKLKLHDKLIDVLPDYPNKEIGEKITIHQLLTHTSGLGDYLMKTMQAPKDKYVEVSDYLPLIVNDPLRFEPGEQFSYSNSGFMLLGAVIEKVSGMTYSEYVTKNIYDIAGMNDTGFELYAKSSMKNLATPLTRWFPGANGKLSEDKHPGKGGPAGGGYSTVQDWINFGRALKNYKLLDKEHYQLLITPQNVINEGTAYGYGFSISDIFGIKSIGHNGGAPGINGEFTYFSNGYAISILGNLDPPSATSLRRAFVSLMLKAESKLPKPSLSGNVSFELEGFENAQQVTLSGSFNNNDPYNTIMEKKGDKWICSIDLKPGEYTYNFVVDGETILDPKNPEKTGRGPMTFSKLVVE